MNQNISIQQHEGVQRHTMAATRPTDHVYYQQCQTVPNSCFISMSLSANYHSSTSF